MFVCTSHFLSLASKPIQPYSGPTCTREDATKDCGFPSIPNTHGRPPFTLPATLPVALIFPHYPTPTLPEVKKPYRHSLLHICLRESLKKQKMGKSMVFCQTKGGRSPGVVKKPYCFFEKVFLLETMFLSSYVTALQEEETLWMPCSSFGRWM